MKAVSFLFDTDAASETLRPHPAPGYLTWLKAIPRQHLHISTVTIAEMLEGAHRLANPIPMARRIEELVLPAYTHLAFNAEAARVFGLLAGVLRKAGTPIADLDLMIAATTIACDLELVTGNLKHFQRVPGLRICHAFVDARLDPKRKR